MPLSAWIGCWRLKVFVGLLILNGLTDRLMAERLDGWWTDWWKSEKTDRWINLWMDRWVNLYCMTLNETDWNSIKKWKICNGWMMARWMDAMGMWICVYISSYQYGWDNWRNCTIKRLVNGMDIICSAYTCVGWTTAMSWQQLFSKYTYVRLRIQDGNRGMQIRVILLCSTTS